MENTHETKVIKGYKGFDKDLKCRDFQYEIGKTYETYRAKLCEEGFHFCENPLDVLSYYPICENGAMNRFCEVEGSGEIDKDSDDTKIACSKIKIGTEIKLDEFVKACVKFIFDKIKWENKEHNTGNRSAAANTGDRSVATNTGHSSAATNTGYWSAATNTGNGSVAANTGYLSAATNTGDGSAATNTGHSSAATNTGNGSVAANTGNRSVATVEGEDSIAIVTGKSCKAKGSLGCWIVLTERGGWNGNIYPIIDIKAFKVDGINVKADTFYMLIDGELKEAE